MLLPKECSFRGKSKHCTYPPSEVMSIATENGEYMVGVICSKHKTLVRRHVQHLQRGGAIPEGKIRFQDIKMVTTSCIKTY
ncbi:MAG: hypothetical protein M3219_00360 [Thermoproteota archaeon]|nr:hypothetical protein [Thermoproteota archaeon]